jgi:hypothetical protein
MRKGYARQVRTVSQDGRLSLFQVERPKEPIQAAEALANRFGSRHIEGRIRAFVVTAIR